MPTQYLSDARHSRCVIEGMPPGPTKRGRPKSGGSAQVSPSDLLDDVVTKSFGSELYNSRNRSTSRGGYLHAGRARLTNGSIAAPERRREYGKCRTVRTKDPFQNSRFRKAPYLAVALFIAIFHVGTLWFGNVLFSRGAQVMPAFRGFAVDLVIVLVFGTRYWPILLAVFFGSSMG